MKYHLEIEINKPRNEVVSLFLDLDRLEEWQINLIEVKPLNGKERIKGDKTELTYDQGNRIINMSETVLENEAPGKFDVLYEANGIINIMKNQFVESNNSNTIWKTDVEFKFKGFMKIVTLLMKYAFRNQTRQTMQNFKDFAENQ